MEVTPLCTVVIPAAIPAEEIKALETALNLSQVKVQKLGEWVMGVDISPVGKYSLKVAQSINNWRPRLKDKNIEPLGKLEHPHRPPLDPRKATPEEVREWLPSPPK